MRVKDDGESEGRSVMGRIGVAPQGYITPHESEQTSVGCFMTRSPEESSRKGKQMTAAVQAGAPFGNPATWSQIDWDYCLRQVRRLQARIVKAASVGRWNKVKILQWLLTHSFTGKTLAVKRVTENKGKNTPGVDGIIWSSPQAKSTAIQSLRRRGYRSQPLRRVHIPKSSDPSQTRPLGIPTMSDRAQQALHLLALEPVSECLADPHSYGFRPFRSTADAIAQCFNALAHSHTAPWVLEGDIKSCFDQIGHDWLVRNVPMDQRMLRKWLKAGYIEKGQLFPTEAGTPQGGIISPTAANMALDGLQALLNSAFTRKAKVNLVRYADDFVITGNSKELLATQVQPLVVAFLAERGLTLSATKTKITHVEEGFDFLGQNVRKYRGKLLIKPAGKNVSALLDKVRAIVKRNKASTQAVLINQLNPVIRGWANYHRHVVAKATFTKVDHQIWEMLWQWALRRHPKKGKRWIKERYFHIEGAQHWVFAAEEPISDNGALQRVRLTLASDVPIKRHCKIRSAANPFDPDWESYFAQRQAARMPDNRQGRRKLISLWGAQSRLCPVCDEPITKETGWTIRYRTPRTLGGRDVNANLILLHPNCEKESSNRMFK